MIEKKTTVSNKATVIAPAETIFFTCTIGQNPPRISTGEGIKQKGAVKVASVESHRVPNTTLDLLCRLKTASARIKNNSVFKGIAIAPSHARIVGARLHPAYGLTDIRIRGKGFEIFINKQTMLSTCADEIT